MFIGSCANAKYDDLADRGRRARAATRSPRACPADRHARIDEDHGSRRDDGILTSCSRAGALITNPGCGACAGNGGAMADGEVTLSTANRNFQGRMGSYEAEIYLGSPAAAASPRSAA